MMTEHAKLIAKWAVFVTGAVVAVFVIASFVAPAHAFDGHPDLWVFDHGPKKRYVKNKPRRHPATRVKAWKREEPWPVVQPPAKPGCMALPLTTQGLPAVTENRALERAKDAWASEVSSRIATRFMDLRYAQEYKHRCWRAAVADNALKSVRERLKERIGVIEDGADADKALSYQCEVYAIPCQPEWQVRGAELVPGASPGAPE